MKYSKMFLIALFILPWLSLPLLGRKSVKRFLPAGIFIALVVTFESILAKKRKWWWWYERVHPKLQGGLPLTWGPFLVGSMWILKLTYGKFFIYLIINMVVDTIFTYPFVKFLKNQGIASLVRLKKYQLSMLFFFKSLLLYGFQYIKEND